MKGKFITLEGGEGVGKSTNALFIKEFLEQQAISVVLTREPGGTELAEKIRQLLLSDQNERIHGLTELLLMFAARSQHIEDLIMPALVQGQWVICDRFTDASYAYQGGGRGLDTETITTLENLVQGPFQPDLTLLLDASLDTGFSRVRKRGQLDRFEKEKEAFFQRVRQAYLERAARHADRITIINAAQPLDDVRKDIAQAVQTALL